MSKMIREAKKAIFCLPVYVLPFVAFGIYLFGDILGGELTMKVCHTLNLNGTVKSMVNLLSVGLIALLVMAYIKFAEGRSIVSLGLYKSGFKHCIIGALAAFAAMTLIVLWGELLQVLVFKEIDPSFTNILWVFCLIPFWIIQSGSEELLTRGWVLPEISARSNPFIGIILSSLLFTAMHLSNWGLTPLAMLNIFLVGVLLSLYTLRSDSLYGAVFFHALWNFFQGSFYGLSVSGGSVMKPNLMSFIAQGNPLLSGGTFGMEGGLITTGIVLILIGMVLLGQNDFIRSLFKTPKSEE